MYDEWDDFNRFDADYLLEKSKEKVNAFSSMLQEIKVSKDLGREELFELGRFGIYHRVSGFVNFPVNIKTDVEENFPIWH